MKLLTELAGDIGFAIEFIETRARFDYLAYYDALTGLANRSLFLAVTGGQQLGLFLIDLERFKNINDTLGQAAGDELLRQVADWLRQAVGDPDLVTRFGAESPPKSASPYSRMTAPMRPRWSSTPKSH